VQGVESLVGELLLRDATAGLDPRLKKIVQTQLAGVLPGRLVRPGEAIEERVVRGDDAIRLLRSAVVTAAGLDPETTQDPPPPVLWEDAGRRLLVRIAAVGARFDEGLVELTIPVFCEETGEADVTVAFVTESREQPTGGMCITEDRPRGPAVVVDNWHEPLIALAWHTVLVATNALSGAIGADVAGQPLIARTLSVSREGITVTPMARHSFAQAVRR
jgi:hypothetical protein